MSGVLCPRCHGITQGLILDDDKVCGAVPRDQAPEHAPRTECLGMADFKARVAALLKEIEFHVTVGGGGAPDFDPEWHLCPKCGRDGVHARDCELVALLKECGA